MTIANQERLFESVTHAFQRIGYANHLVLRDYRFADFFSAAGSDRSIDLAVFGQEPADYRSACFGLLASGTSATPDEIASFKALGAPQVFNVINGMTEQWGIGENVPARVGLFRTEELPNRIVANESIWNPSGVLRAKHGFRSPGGRQIDFVDIGLLPALDHEAGKKIDHLVARLLHNIEQAHLQKKRRFDARTVYGILFRFLAAKLLKDREVSTVPAIDFAEPESALRAVQNYYRQTHLGAVEEMPASLLGDIGAEVEATFSFRNISVDTLTYVYENTLVTPDTRSRLGIHSTPSYIADFILSEIPFEDIPRENWTVLDPTCGHGIFLIAAMRRMRALLDPQLSGPERHKFFVDRLRGIDIEAFSIEVARMCLFLADFPEPNGWQLTVADAFAKNVINNEAAKSFIFVGNPPFEKLEGAERETPKPAVLLDRALPSAPEGSFLGIVLPKSFLNGGDYRRQREQLLKNWDVVSVTSLPDRVFTHSDYETVAIVARKRDGRLSIPTARYTEVRDTHRELFKRRHQATWSDNVPQSYFASQRTSSLTVPVLREVWEQLAANPSLQSIATVRIGVQFDPGKVGADFKNVIFDSPRKGTRPGIGQVTDAFHQYECGERVYFNMDPSVRRRNAWDYPWEKPKVIVPAARLGRHPWRFSAVLDLEGRLASRNFFGIWPKEGTVSAETIAAILNGPVAAAYMFAHSARKDNNQRDYRTIPIPALDVLRAADSELTTLVHGYLASVSAARDDDKARHCLLRIDAAVLRLYDLPPRLERKLLDFYWGVSRRVPFGFTGYFPPEVGSWIPLHIAISEDFQRADAASIMKRLPIIDDPTLLDLLKSFGTEGMDE